MEQGFQKVPALRGRPTDDDTEELLDLIRNQEKDVDPDVTFENIMLKKACLKPLQDVPLPSITQNETVFTRKKSKSFPGHWSSSSYNTWKNTELVEKDYGRRKRSDPRFYEKTLLFDSGKDCVKSPRQMRLRTWSLPPLGFAVDEEFQRPQCPTPSRQAGCKGKRWEEMGGGG
ncbi:uncharacterized protein LOC116296984, partial [Actinia tenebrosa]|uniref:Uncharacterized protein LOC116296984 n=1 Tax=Actinia tenebrosa TaxID=6105 RepID=A0A6P8HZW5_ACTTE